MCLDGAAAAPIPALREALVRPTRVGIAAADLLIARGLAPFTGIMGHEFVGVVEDANLPDPAERKKWKGRRVVGAAAVVCGKCDMCKAGLSPHCRARTVIGQAGRDGCFADLLALPMANLTPVPDGVDDDLAVFASPLSAALHTRQLFRVEGKPYITVLGDGRLGLLAVQVMARLNANVRLLGKHASKLALCDKWGVKHRPVGEAGRRADQDVVVDCTGSPTGLTTAMAMVRPRGRIILLSSGYSPATIDLSPIVQQEIELIGCRAGSLAEALDTIRKGEVDVLSLVSRRSRLSEAPAAISAAAADHSAVKVLMEV